jgi:hypothetical protein
MDDKMLELLYRSLDIKLNQNEQNILDTALTNSDELRAHKEAILKMRSSLKNDAPQKFGHLFADRVMQKIEKLEQKSSDEIFFESIFSVFKPIVFAATFLLVFWVSYKYINDGNLFDSAQNSSDITLAEAFDPFNELTTE